MGTLADKLNYLNGTKTAIKTAITNQGGTVTDNDTFRSYADKITNLNVVNPKLKPKVGILFNTSTSISSSQSITVDTSTEIIDINFIDYTIANTLSNAFSGVSNYLKEIRANINYATEIDSIYQMCNGCTLLETVGKIDLSKATDLRNAFNSCSSLTNLGGFPNLGANFTYSGSNYSHYTLTLSGSSLLTHDSLMNVINGLYDLATAGKPTQKLVLGSTNKAKLTADEIAIATNKGWSVS